MKSNLLIASGILLAAGLLGLPSFDWQAALLVGAVVAVATVVVVGIALAPPLSAVLGIALVIGAIGGIAAGFYEGHQSDIRHTAQLERIASVSNQLHIYFSPSGDPERAAPFQCTVVVYEETDTSRENPTVTTKKVEISEADSEEFYDAVNRQMEKWFTKEVQADKKGKERKVKVYMVPYPGEGIYERLKEMAEKNGIRPCVVSRIEARWTPAVPQRADVPDRRGDAK